MSLRRFYRITHPPFKRIVSRGDRPVAAGKGDPRSRLCGAACKFPSDADSLGSRETSVAPRQPSSLW